MYRKIYIQNKSGCSEDQQPNENINKRSREAPPAILAAGPRTQTVFRGRRNDWGDRGNGFRGKGRLNNGRGRGGRNLYWHRTVTEGHNGSMNSSAGPSRTQGNHGASLPVPPGATIDPSAHRMPPTTANFKPSSKTRNESQKHLKNMHFLPRRPKLQRSPSLPPDESISLFTPPPSPRREPSPLLSEGACSPHETPEYRSSSQDHPTLLTRSSSPPHTSPHSDIPTARHYRDVAVQAEEEKVLIPRKRALISSPVLGASVFSARSPSPKRLKLSDVDTKVEVKVERHSPVADALIIAKVTSLPPPEPSSLPKIKEELDSKADAAMLELDRVILSEPKQPSNSPPVMVKRERSPSPPPSVSRLKVTSRTEWFPLPENCRKTSPRWVENRRLLFHREAVKFTRRGFKVTKQLWRPDGLVIEWTSPCSVWSDTLEPTSPKAMATASTDDDVEVIDLTLDDPPLPTSTSADTFSLVKGKRSTTSSIINTTTSSASTLTKFQNARYQSHYHRHSSEKLPSTACRAPISWLLGATPQPDIHSTPSIPTRGSHTMSLSMTSRFNGEGSLRGIPVKDQAEPFSVSRLVPSHICQGPSSSSSRQVDPSGPPLLQMLHAAATTLRYHGMSVSSHDSNPYPVPPVPSSKQEGNDAVLDPLAQALPRNFHLSPVPQVVENSDEDDAPLAKRLERHAKELRSKPEYQRRFPFLERKQVTDERILSPSEGEKPEPSVIHRPPKIPRSKVSSTPQNGEEDSNSDSNSVVPLSKRYRRKTVSGPSSRPTSVQLGLICSTSPTSPYESTTSLVGRDGASTCSALKSSCHELHDVSGGGNSVSIKTQRRESAKQNDNSNPNRPSHMNAVLASFPQRFKPWKPPAKSLIPPRRISSWSSDSDSASDDDSESEPRVGGSDGGSPSSLAFGDYEPMRAERELNGNDVMEGVEVQDHLVRSCSPST